MMRKFKNLFQTQGGQMGNPGKVYPPSFQLIFVPDVPLIAQIFVLMYRVQTHGMNPVFRHLPV